MSVFILADIASLILIIVGIELIAVVVQALPIVIVVWIHAVAAVVICGSAHIVRSIHSSTEKLTVIFPSAREFTGRGCGRDNSSLEHPRQRFRFVNKWTAAFFVEVIQLRQS